MILYFRLKYEKELLPVMSKTRGSASELWGLGWRRRSLCTPISVDEWGSATVCPDPGTLTSFREISPDPGWFSQSLDTHFPRLLLMFARPAGHISMEISVVAVQRQLWNRSSSLWLTRTKGGKLEINQCACPFLPTETQYPHCCCSPSL